jgi:predicted nucleotidyltransferase
VIGISKDERRILLDVLARRAPGVRVWAFGSRAHGNGKRWSDLDLALMSDTPISPATMMMIKLDLSESDLPWRVDVLDWARADDSFKRIIAGDLTPIE